MAKVIIVHTLDHVMTALDAAHELDTPLALQSAPDAIYYAGGLYLLHMFEQAHKHYPQVDATFILDCADAGVETVSAMQMGHRHIRSSAPEELHKKLADIAGQLGVKMMDGYYQSLDLHHAHDLHATCKAWLTIAKSD